MPARNHYKRTDYAYTPNFCEENIWWLGKDLVQSGMEVGHLSVLIFSNPADEVLLFNQQSVDKEEGLICDYHVVLHQRYSSPAQIFDFDSRLAFPVSWFTYYQDTFADQASLKSAYRLRIRVVPLGEYLRCFSSTRNHMLDGSGKPLCPFPDSLPIQSDVLVEAINWSSYVKKETPPGKGGEDYSTEDFLLAGL